MSHPLYLSDQTLSSLHIDSLTIVSAIENILKGIQENKVSATPKTAVALSEGRYTISTLCASDETGFIAVKAVMSNPTNKRKQLPTINGGIMLLDSETGELKSILDANWVTAVRTAGLSAVAAKRLANPKSASIGLIGTGVQAQSHLRLFKDLFPLTTVRAVGRGTTGLKNVQNICDELNLSFESCEAEQCLTRSDIIVSAVTLDLSIQPFIDAELMQPGSFATIVDQAIPWHASGWRAFKRIFIDDISQEQAMEKTIVPLSGVFGDLSNLMNDQIQHNPANTSAFVFRGIAAGDLAIASLAYRHAQNK